LRVFAFGCFCGLINFLRSCNSPHAVTHSTHYSQLAKYTGGGGGDGAIKRLLVTTVACLNER